MNSGELGRQMNTGELGRQMDWGSQLIDGLFGKRD